MKYNISIEEYKPQVKCYYNKLTAEDLDYYEQLWRNTISESTLLAYNQRYELEKQLNDRYYPRIIPRYEEPKKKTLWDKVLDFLTSNKEIDNE